MGLCGWIAGMYEYQFRKAGGLHGYPNKDAKKPAGNKKPLLDKSTKA